LRPSAVHAAGPVGPNELNSGFQDRSSGAYLRIQLDPGQPGYGEFIAAIPGVGLIWPAAPATASPRSDHAIQLRYESSGFVQPQAQLDLEFGVNYQPNGPINSATVRLIGVVDPTHKTGSVELWLNGTHYHLGALAAPSDAGPVVEAYLTDVVAADWVALYTISDSSLKNATSQDQFVAAMQQSMTVDGVVTAATATGSTAYDVTSAGIAYAKTPINLTLVKDGNSSSQQSTLVLVFDAGAWRVLTVGP
jgi:hypothetical protein